MTSTVDPIPSTGEQSTTGWDYEEWARYGYVHGFCSPPVCSTCDGVPTSELEDEEFEELGGRCIHVLRVYTSEEEKAAVELNSSAAVWRATNRGWA